MNTMRRKGPENQKKMAVVQKNKMPRMKTKAAEIEKKKKRTEMEMEMKRLKVGNERVKVKRKSALETERARAKEREAERGPGTMERSNRAEMEHKREMEMEMMKGREEEKKMEKKMTRTPMSTNQRIRKLRESIMKHQRDFLIHCDELRSLMGEKRKHTQAIEGLNASISAHTKKGRVLPLGDKFTLMWHNGVWTVDGSPINGQTTLKELDRIRKRLMLRLQHRNSIFYGMGPREFGKWLARWDPFNEKKYGSLLTKKEQRDFRRTFTLPLTRTDTDTTDMEPTDMETTSTVAEDMETTSTGTDLPPSVLATTTHK